MRAAGCNIRISDFRTGDSTEKASTLAGTSSNNCRLRFQRGLHGLRLFNSRDFARLTSGTNRIDLLFGSGAPGGGKFAGDEVIAGVAILYLDHVAGFTQA